MGPGHLTLRFRHLAVLAACACALFLALGGPATAAAPCWKQLTLDWAADGSVDNTYPIPCYSEAIEHLGTSDALYTSGPDDIRRALQRRIADERGGRDGPKVSSDKPNSSGGDGVPLPLIALGGLALVLVAAGGAGMMRKRGRGDGESTS